VTGGYEPSANGLASAELYDANTGSWTATAAMIEGRTFHTATLLRDGTVLVAGGSRSVYVYSAEDLVPSAELYDPGSGT